MSVTAVKLVLTLLFAVITLFGLLFYYLGKQARIRIVRGDAAMAFDAEGLRRLNELYSLPKTCTEENMRTATLLIRLHACFPSRKPISVEDAKNGIFLVPDGTAAEYEGRSFVLPGGRLVLPYPSNTYDMARDGAVEVEKIRITQPPNEGLEGWIEVHFLQRVCCGF